MGEIAKEELMKDRAAEVMHNLLFRDQAIKQEMDKETTRRQVDRYLSHIVFWAQNGYDFTDKQRNALRVLWELKGGEDGK